MNIRQCEELYILEKKIAIWGIGNKGKNVLDSYAFFVPSIIIDNGYDELFYNNIPIYKETDINNWEQYYIVICILNNEAIVSSLKQKGLKKGIDYDTYLDYFCIKGISLSSSLQEMNNRIREKKDLICKRWISYSYFPADYREKMIGQFFCKALTGKKHNELLGIHWDDYLTDSLVEDHLGFKVLRFSPASSIDESNYKRYSQYYDLENADDKVSEEYILDIAKRRTNNPSQELIGALKQVYVYYDKCIQLLKPTGIMIWGYWNYTHYFFRDLAKKHNVPIRFAEWGLIPGTMLMEPCGRFHDSEISYSNLSLPSKKELETFYSAKKYLTDNRLDSMQSVVDADDENKLKRIKNDRRKVLLIGMCDDDICYNDSEDSYYRRHISSVVKGSIDAFFLLKEICVKNEWNLIFKPHPADEYDSRLLFDYEEGMVIVFHKNLNELITMADVCVAIDSSMNYRVLLYDKPLVQIGHNTMDNEDFIYMVNSRDDVERKLIEALDKGFNEKMKEKCAIFMTRMMKSVLWDDLSDKSVRYGLSKNIDFFDSSLGEGEWI